MNIYDTPGTALGVGDTVMNKRDLQEKLTAVKQKFPIPVQFIPTRAICSRIFSFLEERPAG